MTNDLLDRMINAYEEEKTNEWFHTYDLDRDVLDALIELRELRKTHEELLAILSS